MTKALSILSLLLIIFISSSRATIIYVNANATGLNNGTSWKNSYTSLDDVKITGKIGDTIKVARGTYTTVSSTEDGRSIANSIYTGELTV